MSSKKLSQAVAMLESFNEILEMVKRQEDIRKELDGMEIAKSDKEIAVASEGRKIDREHEKKKGDLLVEINTLSTQKGNLEGENNRLRGQIDSSKDTITAHDETIGSLKDEITELQRQKDEVSKDLSLLTSKVDKIQTTLKN